MKLVALLLVVAAAFAGCAGQGPVEGPSSGQDEGGGTSDADTDGLPAAATRRDVVLLPGEVVSWAVTTPGGQDLDVRFRIILGVVDLTMSGPGKCDGYHLETFTVAYPNGAVVQNKDCGERPAETSLLSLHAGKAAFKGAIELQGGWFGGSLPAPKAAPSTEDDFAGVAGPTAPPTDERAILVTPGEPQDFVVRGQGKAMRLVIGMNHGLSVGGDLVPPKGCEGDDLSFNVLAVSTSGQALAVARCAVLPAGQHTFHLDAGDSAFYGYARLYGATFA